MKLIDASVLTASLCTMCANGELNMDCCCCGDDCETVKMIRGLDTVETMRHGKWNVFHNPRYPAYEIMQCSECKWEIHKSKVRGRDHYFFCPECGARMDGEMNVSD